MAEPHPSLQQLEANRLRLKFNFEAIFKKYEKVDDSLDPEVDIIHGSWFLPTSVEKKEIRKRQERFYAVNENFGLSAISAPCNTKETLEEQKSLLHKCNKRDNEFVKLLELTPFCKKPAYQAEKENKGAKLVMKQTENEYTCTGISVERLEQILRQQGVSGEIFAKNSTNGVASIVMRQPVTVEVEREDGNDFERAEPVPDDISEEFGRVFATVQNGHSQHPLEHPIASPRTIDFADTASTSSEVKTEMDDIEEGTCSYAESRASSIKSGYKDRAPVIVRAVKKENVKVENEEIPGAAMHNSQPSPRIRIKSEERDCLKEEDQSEERRTVVEVSSGDEGDVQREERQQKKEAVPLFPMFRPRKRRASIRVFTPISKKSRDSDLCSIELPRSSPGGDSKYQIDDFEEIGLWSRPADTILESFRSQKSSTIVGLDPSDASKMCANSPNKKMLDLWADYAAEVAKSYSCVPDYVSKEVERMERQARMRNAKMLSGYHV